MPAIRFCRAAENHDENAPHPYFILGLCCRSSSVLAVPPRAMALIDLLRKSPELTQPAAQKEEFEDGVIKPPCRTSENEGETSLTGRHENVKIILARGTTKKISTASPRVPCCWQASFNYERMQASGWLYGLLPALKRSR